MMVEWFVFTLSMSSSKVKIVRQSSRSQDEMFLLRLWMQPIDKSENEVGIIT